MTHPSYPAILDRFSQIQADPYEVDKHDLLVLGITPEMIPDLIETILDEKYYGDDESIEGYPHLFAYIALGQLKTIAAIDGLILGVNKWVDGDWFEWFCEAMPDIFGSIGSIAIPSLTELLQDKTLTFNARTSALQYLYPISVAHPEERDRCIAIIAQELEQFADNDPEFNGYLVMSLVGDFKAVEVAPLIESAYASARVDMAFIGDWEDVQVFLGLIPERISLRPKYNFFGNSAIEDGNLDKMFARQSSQIDGLIENNQNRSKSANAKNKAKRKQAKKARQKNRRK
jgi:Protein of unknown function (DUF1186)